MILSDLVRVVFRGYRTVLACILLPILVALPLLALQNPLFRAASSVYVQVPLPASAGDDQLTDAEFAARQRTVTIKELSHSDLVLSEVAESLDPPMTAAELAPHVTSLSALNTTLVDIIVVWDDPEVAADVANAVAEEAIALAGSSGAEGSPEFEVVQSNFADPPASSFSPNYAFVLGLAAAAGLLLGIGVVLIRHAFSPRIWGPRELARWGDVPVVAVLREDDDVTGYAGAAQALTTDGSTDPLFVVDTSRSGLAAEVASGLQEHLGAEPEVRGSDARLDLGNAIDGWVPGSDVVVAARRRASRRADVDATVTRLRMIGAGRIRFILVVSKGRRRP